MSRSKCPWCIDYANASDDIDPETLCRNHEAEYEGSSVDELDRRDREQAAEYGLAGPLMAAPDNQMYGRTARATTMHKLDEHGRAVCGNKALANQPMTDQMPLASVERYAFLSICSRCIKNSHPGS